MPKSRISTKRGRCWPLAVYDQFRTLNRIISSRRAEQATRAEKRMARVAIRFLYKRRVLEFKAIYTRWDIGSTKRATFTTPNNNSSAA
jgi:hypothetical protein